MTTAISPSRRSAIVGTKVTFRNLAPGGFGLPQRIAIIGFANTAASNTLDKMQIFSAAEAAAEYGFGSQIHIMATQLFPVSGDGVGDIPVTVYPLADGTTAATGQITPSGTTTADGVYEISIGNVKTNVLIPDGSNEAAATPLISAAINAALEMAVTAVDTPTDVDLTSKWQGLTANEPQISITGPSVGMTFVVTQMSGGAGDPAIDSALLSQFGEVWETIVLNGLGGTTAALDALSQFDEGNWLPENGRPLLGAFYASTETDLATAITVPDGRGTDRTNVQLPAPGSPDLTWKIAANMVRRIAQVANGVSSGTDYIGQIASGIEVGPDDDQWDSAQRQTAVVSGASTVVSRDGNYQLNDTVTFYHPSGDPLPAYRWVVDKNKIMNMLFDLKATFDTPTWQAPPLIPDNQTTTDRTAKQPKMARAAVAALIQDWGNRALISDPATALTTIQASINSGNNRRLDIAFTVQISGNAGTISIDFDWGFFFGAA